MKIHDEPKEHKRAIFLKRSQIEKALKDFKTNDVLGGEERSGYYRFNFYATEDEMNVMELRALIEVVDRLKSENNQLREELCRAQYFEPKSN